MPRRCVLSSGARLLLTYMSEAAANPRFENPYRKDSAMKDDIVIVGAVRTPVGAFNGAFASVPAHDLGKVAIKAAIDPAGVEVSRAFGVILGQILQAGQGQGPARQASINAGIPVEAPAYSANTPCGS